MKNNFMPEKTINILDIIFKNIRNSLISSIVITAGPLVSHYPEKLSLFGPSYAELTSYCLMLIGATLFMLNIFSFLEEFSNQLEGSIFKKTMVWASISLPILFLNVILLGGHAIQFKEQFLL